MVARDFDQYLFFYEFLNAFTESLEKKLTGKELIVTDNCIFLLNMSYTT